MKRGKGKWESYKPLTIVPHWSRRTSSTKNRLLVTNTDAGQAASSPLLVNACGTVQFHPLLFFALQGERGKGGEWREGR